MLEIVLRAFWSAAFKMPSCNVRPPRKIAMSWRRPVPVASRTVVPARTIVSTAQARIPSTQNNREFVRRGDGFAMGICVVNRTSVPRKEKQGGRKETAD